MNLKIIDNFYTQENFGYMMTSAMLSPYISTWQPNRQCFLNRTNSYACHETKDFVNSDKTLKLFIDTFQEKTGIIIEEVQTVFRKIYSADLKNIFKYGVVPHQDDKKYNIAGVIHYNSSGLDDGTGLYSSNEKEIFYQIEPDVLIGAKPNRCVFYDSQIWHRPLQDKTNEMRIVQPFFIKTK
jgi:hypothetical protein